MFYKLIWGENMGITDIISKSVRYPFSDLTKFLMVGIGIIIFDLDNISAEVFGNDSFIVLIALIIAILFSFVMIGYSVNITKKGIDNSKEFPNFDYVNNFIDGLKLFVVYLVYFIIPTIITLALLFMFDAIGTGFNQVMGSLRIWVVFAVIIFILFGIFALAAQARFAISHSISDALNIGEVFADVKRIGILKIILFSIVVCILLFVYAALLGIVTIVPVIGIVLIDIILGAFIFIFFSYGVGLLYSDV